MKKISESKFILGKEKCSAVRTHEGNTTLGQADPGHSTSHFDLSSLKQPNSIGFFLMGQRWERLALAQGPASPAGSGYLGTRICSIMLQRTTPMGRTETQVSRTKCWGEDTQARTDPNYLLTLVVFVTCISGNDCLVSLSGDLFYPFFTLLLYLFHLVDTLVPGEGKWKDVWVSQALPAGPHAHSPCRRQNSPYLLWTQSEKVCLCVCEKKDGDWKRQGDKDIFVYIIRAYAIYHNI